MRRGWYCGVAIRSPLRRDARLALLQGGESLLTIKGQGTTRHHIACTTKKCLPRWRFSTLSSLSTQNTETGIFEISLPLSCGTNLIPLVPDIDHQKRLIEKIGKELGVKEVNMIAMKVERVLIC
jgi:hypothetical protein